MSPTKDPAALDLDDLRTALAEGGGSTRDLERFDAFVSRRRLLGLTGTAGAAAALAMLGTGVDSVLRGALGQGILPMAWAAEEADEAVAAREKPGMPLKSPKPLTAGPAPEVLDEDETPAAHHFVRNHGLLPPRARAADPQGWKLRIDGQVERPLELDLAELQRFPTVTVPMVLECAGNGRALFEPRVAGEPWEREAVGCGRWTGVRLKDVLARAGVKASAVYTAHYGEDPPLGSTPRYSRGIPIAKAMDDSTLLAFQLEGKPLPALNGWPVRLLVPGWIGSCSHKWLERIELRDKVHDAPAMSGYAYRMPAYPVAPGSKPPESDMVIATTLKVKSMLTRPMARATVAAGTPVTVAGHAWSGETRVARVLVTADYGLTWKEARLDPPASRYAWSRFTTELTFPSQGYYEVWSRAFDDAGDGQPLRQPWNPKGYLGNVIHRLPLQVAG